MNIRSIAVVHSLSGFIGLVALREAFAQIDERTAQDRLAKLRGAL